MKLVLMICLLFLGLVFSACRVYTIVDLDNPEFPRELKPADLSGELLDKYSVGDVIVEPRLWHADGFQTNYAPFILFFSETNTSVAFISSVCVSVDGKQLEHDVDLCGKQSSDWKLQEGNKPFYVCYIEGTAIERPKVEMTKARVDVSLVVSVKDVNLRPPSFRSPETGNPGSGLHIEHSGAGVRPIISSF